MIAAAVAVHIGQHTAWTFDPFGTDGDVFVDHLPATPHTAVAVMTTGGLPYPTLAPVALPTVQLRVRGEPDDGPATVMRSAVELLALFDGLDGVTLDGEPGGETVWLIACSALQSDPVPIGVDEQNRHEATVNLSMRVHRPTPLRA